MRAGRAALAEPRRLFSLSLSLAKIGTFSSSPCVVLEAIATTPNVPQPPLVSSTSSISQVLGFSWELVLSSLADLSCNVVKQSEFGTQSEREGREMLSINSHKRHYFLEIIYLKFKTILLHTANCAL